MVCVDIMSNNIYTYLSPYNIKGAMQLLGRWVYIYTLDQSSRVARCVDDVHIALVIQDLLFGSFV